MSAVRVAALVVGRSEELGETTNEGRREFIFIFYFLFFVLCSQPTDSFGKELKVRVQC